MFRDCVTNPIDPIPVEYVKSLKRLVNEPDYSLTCLGIALLKSRIEDYKGIDGGYYEFIEEEKCVKDFLEIANNVDECPLFCYYRYSSAGDKAEIIRQLKDKGFSVKDSIGALLETRAETKCVAVYHETKNIAVWTANAMKFLSSSLEPRLSLEVGLRIYQRDR